MKNACLLLTDQSVYPSNGRVDALRAFERAGYTFSQVRWLCVADWASVKESVADAKKLADNLVVLTCGFPLLSVAKDLSFAFGVGEAFGSVSGEGVFSDGEKTLFLLSGNDESYVKEICIPYLQKKEGHRLGTIVLRCVGVEKDRMQVLIQKGEGYAQGLVKIAEENRFGEDILRIFYDERTPRMLTDDLLRFFADNLKDNLYALEDTPLEKTLIELLRLRRKKISVAESFTGGGVGRRIVSVSGASDVYVEGLNTYSEQSKMRRLGVSEFTLRSQGAVSEQTAYEMAAGLLEQGCCDVSIATTGIAGPNGDGSGLPVGTCCIAIGLDKNVYVYRYTLQGDRETITETAITYALFLASKQLKNM